MRRRLLALRHWVNSRSLRVKFLTVIVSLIVLSTVLLYTISNSVISKEYREQVLHSAESSFSQAKDFTEQLLWPMVYVSDMFASNQTVLEVALRSSGGIDEQYRDMLKLRQSIDFQNLTVRTVHIKLYLSGTLHYTENNINFGVLEQLEEEYPGFFTSRDRYTWTAPEPMVLELHDEPVPVVSLLRKLISPDNLSETIGVARINLAAGYLDEIISKADVTQNGVAFIINSNREVVASSSHEQLAALGVTEPEAFASLLAGQYAWDEVRLAGKWYIAKVDRLESTDWFMVSLVPRSEIYAPGRRVAYIMAVAMVAILLLATLLAYLFSDRMSRSLRELAKGMVAVRGGRLKGMEGPDSEDEIGLLYDSFNYMVEQMQFMLEQQYENGITLKGAELRALQAQINPHFLYNTLDLINWRAMEADAPEIAEIAQALARYYKMTLKSGRDVITVEEELVHIETYVKIQNYRFGGRIQLELDVPEEVRRCPVPKIVLQPLVENAVMHGIRKSPSLQQGHITIRGSVEEGDAVLAVTDNGQGMDERRMEEIVAGERSGDTHSYGVYNIIERLRLHFGDRYGLYYESVLGSGTTVYLRIPFRPG